jgi:hypothetical protein
LTSLFFQPSFGCEAAYVLAAFENQGKLLVLMRAIVNKNYNIESKISKIRELQYTALSRQNDLNKEIIRRLKIQNKKLIEQVTSLRGQVKLYKKILAGLKLK